MGRAMGFGLMSLVWGLTWLPMKGASEVVPPIFLAAVRFGLAAACFGLYGLVAGVPLRTRQVGRLVAASLLITTGCYAFVFWGVARSPSGLSAVVNLSLMPVFLIVIGAAYGQEPITLRRLGSIGLGVAGLALLFSGRIGSGGGTAVALGLAAVVAGTLFYAWGSVVSRPLVEELAPVAVAFWECLIGGAALFPISALVEGWDPGRFAELRDPRALVGLGFLVLGGSLTAFSIFLWLVRDWGAFRAGLYCFVSPIIAVAVGVWWAREPFGWPEGIGMAVMLAATALVMSERVGPLRASAATGSSRARPA